MVRASGLCNSGASAGTPTASFAVINFPGNGTVAAELALKGDHPDTTYDVFLVQTPSGADCVVVDGTLTTKGQGNGILHLSEPLLAGTSGAFIYFGPVPAVTAGITHNVPMQ